MTLASEFGKYDRTNTLWDRETWDALFGDAVRASQEIADSVALLLKDIVVSTSAGESETEKLRNTAREGIEWVWPYTQEYELCFKAFLYSIEGITVGGDDPRILLKEAIARADAHLAEADSVRGPKAVADAGGKSTSLPGDPSKRRAGRSKSRGARSGTRKVAQASRRARKARR
jgi:hypothetical protein